jgi:DNA invertase Pin-like site-specific DNA recombinase
MRVATYSRVSTSHHDQNPQVQVEELRRYCQARGFSIAHEIVDHGFSGKTDARPGLKQLFSLARGREVDGIVCLKMDRLFRSLKHLVASLEEFQSLGVTFIAIRDAVDYSSPSGRLFAQILGALGEFERELARERTVLGLEYARRQGKRLGRPMTRPDEAIVTLREKGLSYSAIQRQLGCERSAVYRALKAVAKTSSKAEFQLAEKARHRKGR